jgi:hypothetical protein
MPSLPSAATVGFMTMRPTVRSNLNFRCAFSVLVLAMMATIVERSLNYKSSAEMELPVVKRAAQPP